MSRVAVLMSGGVDSSAAALVLAEGGHEIIGITARMWDRGSRCCDDEDIERARRMCHALGMRHIAVDLRREFEERVVGPFRADYMRGLTPNPCAVCNREIKFGELFRTAMTYGCDLVATGHYAGLGECGDEVLLKEPACTEKSQTYFLTLVDPGVLGRLIFPLASSSKDGARAMLAARGLEARSRESQDLCFITNGKYEEFLRSRPGGEVAAGEGGRLLDTGGNVVGSHRGHFAYTIGQRLGYHGRRTYVIEKRPESNEVVVGEREAAMARNIEAREANWFVDPGRLAGDRVLVKYRYNTPATPARISELEEGRFEVIADEPCFAPAPGQILACYKGDFLLGGGVISGAGP